MSYVRFSDLGFPLNSMANFAVGSQAVFLQALEQLPMLKDMPSYQKAVAEKVNLENVDNVR